MSNFRCKIGFHKDYIVDLVHEKDHYTLTLPLAQVKCKLCGRKTINKGLVLAPPSILKYKKYTDSCNVLWAPNEIEQIGGIDEIELLCIKHKKGY